MVPTSSVRVVKTPTFPSRNRAQGITRNVLGVQDKTLLRSEAQDLTNRRVFLSSAVFSSTVFVWRQVPSEAALPTAYDTFAKDYDSLNDGTGAKLLGLEDLRRLLLAQASGDVLECGVGTGLNLPLYNPANVKSISAIDLSEGMLSQASIRAAELPLRSRLTLLQGNVESLPFENESFDTVVDTFSLCVYPDPLAALMSMRRVVRSGGRILLLEHNRSPNGVLGAYQDLTAQPVAKMSKGCVYNQDVRSLVQQAGLEVVTIKPALGGLIQAVEARKVL
mmetsp:Transcript_30167/g.57934  ORF Transcript_30167/g.57934 Transcript_30167/m.57934 type:complete len:278 (-) Transcript_30167:321-1154(-)